MKQVLIVSYDDEAVKNGRVICFVKVSLFQPYNQPHHLTIKLESGGDDMASDDEDGERIDWALFTFGLTATLSRCFHLIHRELKLRNGARTHFYQSVVH